jgi:small-conductance mechanosensitive channel
VACSEITHPVLGTVDFFGSCLRVKRWSARIEKALDTAPRAVQAQQWVLETLALVETLKLAEGRMVEDALAHLAQAVGENYQPEIDKAYEGAVTLLGDGRSSLIAAEAARVKGLEERVRELETEGKALLSDAEVRLAVAENARQSNMRLGQVRELRWWINRLHPQAGGE